MTTVYMLPVELYEKLKVLVKTGKIEEITSYLDEIFTETPEVKENLLE